MVLVPVGSTDKNRKVSKDANEVIGIAKDDARTCALKNLSTTKLNNDVKQIKWKDEIESVME